MMAHEGKRRSPSVVTSGMPILRYHRVDSVGRAPCLTLQAWDIESAAGHQPL